MLSHHTWSQAWTNSLLHFPKPQSKRIFIFKAATHQTKTQQIWFIWFMAVYGCAIASLNKFPFARAKTSIQTHFHLHSCYPQTKKQHCSICSACGHKLQIRSCVSCMVAWCRMYLHASRSRIAALYCWKYKEARHKHRVFAQCAYSARHSARHSAQPQNGVNTAYFLKNNEKNTKKHIIFVFVSCQKMQISWYLHGFVAVHWAVHWTVHCACTVRALRKTRSLCNSASGGVEAQSPFVGSSCEDESVFGLGFWHVQKGICSSLCLHIHKPETLSRTVSGFFTTNSHPIKLIAKKLARPFPPNSMLLRRFAWKGRQKKKTAISVRMPACIRQQQIKGAGGIRCDVTTWRRMAVSSDEPSIIGYHKIS